MAKGASYERVVDVLRDSALSFRVTQEPCASAPYFRESRISVLDDRSTILEMLQPKEFIADGYVVDAEYQLTPHFDFTKLNGEVTFRQGSLVERVILSLSER